MTKLSIITINRNNATGLRKTIESVVSQTFTDFEYIIIDGASTDESVDIIKEYVGSTTELSDESYFWPSPFGGIKGGFVSEPDKGIYNAMNKGILKAKGEYLLFLNSGDIFSSVYSLNFFNEHLYENYDIIYGDIKVVNKGVEYLKTYPTNLSFRYFLEDTLPHPASLIKRSLFSTIENYDESLMICSDWLFFIKAICLHNSSYFYIGKEISTFYYDGISSDPVNEQLINSEKLFALKTYFGAFYEDYKRLDSLESFRNRVLESKVIRAIKKLGLLKRIKYD